MCISIIIKQNYVIYEKVHECELLLTFHWITVQWNINLKNGIRLYYIM